MEKLLGRPIGGNEQPDDSLAGFPELQKLLSEKRITEPPPEPSGTLTTFVKNIAKKTSLGIAAQAVGWADVPTDQGTIANFATELAAFGVDPLTWATGGLGEIVGKKVATKLGEYALEKGLIGAAARTAPKAASAATQLAGISAGKDIAAGNLPDPLKALQSAAVGAAIGPAATIANPFARAAGEAASLAIAQPAVEGRLPTGEDALTAAATIGGFKLSHVIVGKLAKLAGKDTVSRKEFADATETKEGHVPPLDDRIAIVKLAAERTQKEKEISDAQRQVSDVRGVEGGGDVEVQGGEDYQRGGEAGAVIPPQEVGQVQEKGSVNDVLSKQYETRLTPEEEARFQEWKAKYAPRDSGYDYDLRGAFKAGLRPAANGHWPDTFKKPNHPTFSNESKYAKDHPELAGSWKGETYLPPKGRQVQEEGKAVLGPQGEVAKQPWEMTRQQFVDGISERVQRPTAKETADALDAALDAPNRKTHYESVREALAAGKPVPPEVLADYPDLAKQPTVAEVPAELTKEISDLQTRIKDHERVNDYRFKKGTKRKGQLRSDDPAYAKLMREDVPYQTMKSELTALKRQRGALEAKATRATNLAAPITPQDRLAATPLHKLPDPVAQRIQDEAQAHLADPRITSVKTREALQKIIRDKGEDVGSEVQKQKKRLIEYLMAQKDFRTIFEKQIGAPTREDPDAVVEAHLNGASPEEIAKIHAASMEPPDNSDQLERDAMRAESANPEVQRPGLFAQETFDPLTGKQGELPLAPRAESAPPDVAGQGLLPTESPKIAAARAKLDASLEEYRKHTEGKTFSGIDPKSVALIAKVFKDELGLGWAKFSDYVASLGRKFGAAVVRTHAALIRDTWNEHRKTNPNIDAAGDVEAILVRGKIPEAPPEITRPDLGVPVSGATAKAGLNIADTLRNAVGEPQRETFRQWDAEGDRRLAARGPELVAGLIDGSWEAADPADNRVQIKILTALGKQAVDTGDWKNLILGSLHYREEGTDQGRILASRRAIGDLTQPDQQAFFNQRELAKPPEDVAKKIKAAEERERQAKTEQTKLPFPAAPAPEGFKMPAAETKKPRTAKQEAAVERRKVKTAEDHAKAWAIEVEKIRAKLAGLGHDVDRALRGQLDPIAQREFIRDVHALKATIPDKLYEWWSNSILSGPATQVVNATGNVAHAGWYFTAERITDAVVSSIARAVGIKSNGARFGELKYVYRAFVEGWGKSSKNFFETWHSEVPQFYAERGLEEQAAYGYHPGSIAGKKGKIIRTPWRTLAATDDFVKNQVYEMEAASLAYRQAVKEGYKGETLTRRMRELIEDKGSEVNKRATDVAIRLAFQESTSFAKNTSKLIRDIPGGRYVLPFITTPFNILKTGIRKSPFGSIKLAEEILKASKSGDWSHIHGRVAEQVLAWGATLALAYSNDPANPWITGNDKNRPYSIKIGGQWYSYGRIEPFATTLGLLVDGINKIHQGGDLYESLKAPFDALLDRVDNQTFFTGISDFMKAARYQDSTYVVEWASKFPASWVPNLVRAPLRAGVDETPQRRVWGKGEERADRILKRGLQAFDVMPDQPKYDLWGRKTPKDGSPIPHTDWIWRSLSPVGERRYVETIGDRLLTRWNAAHPDDRAEFKAPNPYFVEKGKTSYFTDSEYATYVRESGKLTQQRVIAAQERGAFNMNKPTERDIKRLQKIIETSRQRIRNAIKRSRRKAAA